MPISQFSEMSSLSNSEISETIIEIERKLFNLRFKKATRQSFKSHQLKLTKREIAQLKTLLTLRVQNLKLKE